MIFFRRLRAWTLSHCSSKLLKFTALQENLLVLDYRKGLFSSPGTSHALFEEHSKGVFLSVNPKTDFRSKNGFRVPFGTKSGFLIWWILFEKGFTGFEIRRIQIQINGLVIYAVPFTVDPKLVRWSSGISSWSIPIEAVEFPRCCHLPQNIWKH